MAGVKKIGLIGGLSWHSTAQYYRLINQYFNDARGGSHSAPLLLESLNQQQFDDAVAAEPHEATARSYIVDAGLRLKAAGATVLAMCANGIHRFYPDLSRAVGIPVVHIAEATAKAVSDQKIKTVALLGINKTMAGNFYPQSLKKYGINMLIPDEAQRNIVEKIIFSELCHGKFLEESRNTYLGIIETLQARGASGVILGCTEIPLLLKPDEMRLPSFDTTALHSKAIVDTLIRSLQ
jgi:aspartate racemase